MAGEGLLTTLCIDDPSTLLSMDSGGVATHAGDNDFDISRSAIACARPPDINLLLTSPPASWLNDPSDILDLAHPHDLDILTPLKPARKSGKREDAIWAASFFFRHYFRPAFTEKCKTNNKLRQDLFLVQHDMENIYMWVFREKPQNCLGKMQLRSYMNGHSRLGEPQFPFSVHKGFARSHCMQRKQYRGLSNPQCIHGIEIVRCPAFCNVSDDDKHRWTELTGRDFNFTIPLDAEGFTSWRSLPHADYGFERCELRSLHGSNKRPSSKRFLGKLNGTALYLLNKLPCANEGSGSDHGGQTSSHMKSQECCIGSKGHSRSILGVEIPLMEQPAWQSDFSGVMTKGYGPVTAAKTIYEDEEGYLIMVSLPFTDMQRVRVSWHNTATHGVVKIHCISTARSQYIERGERTFKLADPSPEHCPPGNFIREIALETRIPENAELQAFYVEAGAGLEIIIPKHHVFSEEREVRIFLPPQLGYSESLLS